MLRPLSLGIWAESLLLLLTLHIWISCSCKPGARWETWRAMASCVSMPQETNCMQFLALPDEIWLLLLFVAYFFCFFSVTFFVSLTSARLFTCPSIAECHWTGTMCHARFPRFFWECLKVAFALLASAGDFRTCGYDKNFPTLQIVKDNQALAQRGVQRSKGFLSITSQLAEPLRNLQGKFSGALLHSYHTLSFFMPLGTQECSLHFSFCQTMVCSASFSPDMAGTAWVNRIRTRYYSASQKHA